MIPGEAAQLVQQGRFLPKYAKWLIQHVPKRKILKKWTGESRSIRANG
jgi:hypothetical protein